MIYEDQVAAANQARSLEHLTLTIHGQVGEAARGSMGVEGVEYAEVEATLQAAAESMVDADPALPTTCMDDGEAAGTLAGQPSDIRRKMAGGCSASGWLGHEWSTASRSRRRVAHILNSDAESPLDRVADYTWQRHQVGLRAGAHIRPNPHGHADSCGCGMVDNAPKVNALAVEESVRPEGDRLAETTAALMRGQFNPAVHAGVVTDAQRLLDGMDTHGWSGRGFIDALREAKTDTHPRTRVLGETAMHSFGISLDDDARTYLHEALDTGSEADHDIEVTVGEHAPVMLVINYGDQTLDGGGTIDRDEFVARTGKKVLWIDEQAIWDQARDECLNPYDPVEVMERYQAIFTANIAGSLTLGAPHLWLASIGTPRFPEYN